MMLLIGGESVPTARLVADQEPKPTTTQPNEAASLPANQEIQVKRTRDTWTNAFGEALRNAFRVPNA